MQNQWESPFKSKQLKNEEISRAIDILTEDNTTKGTIGPRLLSRNEGNQRCPFTHLQNCETSDDFAYNKNTLIGRVKNGFGLHKDFTLL